MMMSVILECIALNQLSHAGITPGRKKNFWK